jgi:hypothetical protein
VSDDLRAECLDLGFRWMQLAFRISGTQDPGVDLRAEAYADCAMALRDILVPPDEPA